MRSHVPATKPAAKDSSPLQRKPALRIGEHDDAYEREADRTADAIIKGGANGPGPALSKISILPPLQRVKRTKKKSEEEKYTEAAKKLGEAFLETGPGKEIKQKAEKLGDAFISTLPGKIITGSAITGAVAALAATHSELPIGIPEIPLDKIKPGLKLNITYEGPVDKPTKVMATFSIPLGAPRKSRKPAMTKSQRFRAETARMAMEQQQFRDSMKTPQQRADDAAVVNAWVLSQMTQPGSLLSLGITGSGLPPPLAPYASEYKISGEQPKREQPKKKKKETAVQRKSSNNARVGATPAIVNEVLESSGQALEPAARSFMESRFGHDFSQVRIHTGNLAGQSADAINASAYTVRNNIVFANGQYSPASQEGRRLLAHELTHVLQQSGLTVGPRETPIVRRKANVPVQALTPPQALKETLDGDDDSVRDLTRGPHWGAVKITAEQTALLLIQLLDGATLDEDEIAGLAVLKKALALGVFDDSLTRLGDKDRFDQLLDDYHDVEYLSLLDLLSKNIRRLNVKALYLDAFIAMWWVNEHEERAIVVLLEHTVLDDQFKLLTPKGRQQVLRDAIDTDSLTIRYEDIAGKVNELRQADLGIQLIKFFVTTSRGKLAAKKRTQAEINRMLFGLTRDLALELGDYKTELQKALSAKNPDADAIAEINKNFETSLEALLELKKKEFKIEFKYGVELSRLLKNVRGRSWSSGDLNEIDKILAKIPPEILLANPGFQSIRRAGPDPERAGQAPRSGAEIRLFGTLTAGTTVHELGHVISFDDGEQLQNEFNTVFKWEVLSDAELTRLIPNRKARKKLTKKLEEDRTEKRQGKNNRHAYGDHFYRYNRYGGDKSYLRHPKNACFISNYAATDRMDDFAEAFEAYVLEPVKLHEKCPDKYKFMRQKVFTGYLYGKQANRILADFDKDVTSRINKLAIKGKLLPEFRKRYVGKLRDELEKKLKMTGESLEKKSLADKPTNEMNRVPLTGEEAQPVAKPYQRRLIELIELPAKALKQWNTFSSEAVQFKAGAKKKYSKAADSIGILLGHEFQKDILRLMQPHARLAIDGKNSNLPKWSQKLQGLSKKYQRAFKVATSYLPFYKRLKDTHFKIEVSMMIFANEKEEVGPTAWKLLKQFPKAHPRRRELKAYIYERRSELSAEIGELQGDVLQKIKEGTPYGKAKLTTFNAVVRAYERDIRKFIKQKGLKPKQKARTGRKK